MCSTLNIRSENNLQSVALINLIEFNLPFLVLGVSELHMLTYVKQYANLYLEPRALQMFLITKKKKKKKRAMLRPQGSTHCSFWPDTPLVQWPCCVTSDLVTLVPAPNCIYGSL